jgi:hypothetical protein
MGRIIAVYKEFSSPAETIRFIMSFMTRNPDLKDKYINNKERDHFLDDILKVERLLVEEFIIAHRVT